MTLLPLIVSLALTPAYAGKKAQNNPTDKLNIRELNKRADLVIRGEVLASRIETSDRGVFTIASILVDEVLRGQSSPLVEVRIPGGKIGDLEFNVDGAPKLIPGYDMLLFIDDDRVAGWGQGAFVLEGGFAWRKRNADGFDSPRLAHDWVDIIDPSPEYEIFSLAVVRQQIR